MRRTRSSPLPSGEAAPAHPEREKKKRQAFVGISASVAVLHCGQVIVARVPAALMAS